MLHRPNITFYICCFWFWCVMTPLNSVLTAVLYINFDNIKTRPRSGPCHQVRQISSIGLWSSTVSDAFSFLENRGCRIHVNQLMNFRRCKTAVFDKSWTCVLVNQWSCMLDSAIRDRRLYAVLTCFSVLYAILASAMRVLIPSIRKWQRHITHIVPVAPERIWQWGRTPVLRESAKMGGGAIRRRASQLFWLWNIVQLVAFVMVSTVWSASRLLFFYSQCPRAQPFVKVGDVPTTYDQTAIRSRGLSFNGLHPRKPGLLLIYRLRDGRLSWPDCLTHSGHYPLSGHMPTIDQA